MPDERTSEQLILSLHASLRAAVPVAVASPIVRLRTLREGLEASGAHDQPIGVLRSPPSPPYIRPLSSRRRRAVARRSAQPWALGNPPAAGPLSLCVPTARSSVSSRLERASRGRTTQVAGGRSPFRRRLRYRSALVGDRVTPTRRASPRHAKRAPRLSSRLPTTGGTVRQTPGAHPRVDQPGQTSSRATYAHGQRQLPARPSGRRTWPYLRRHRRPGPVADASGPVSRHSGLSRTRVPTP